jgi:hypothetical protein
LNTKSIPLNWPELWNLIPLNRWIILMDQDKPDKLFKIEHFIQNDGTANERYRPRINSVKIIHGQK